MAIACATANQQKSFCEWVKKYNPLSRPRDFVSETHDFLKQELRNIVGDENNNKDFKFSALIKIANDENLFYSEKYNPIIPILRNLNAIRNRFHHSTGENFSWEEKQSYVILYLINLALVWSRVVIEVENPDQLTVPVPQPRGNI